MVGHIIFSAVLVLLAAGVLFYDIHRKKRRSVWNGIRIMAACCLLFIAFSLSGVSFWLAQVSGMWFPLLYLLLLCAFYAVVFAAAVAYLKHKNKKR